MPTNVTWNGVAYSIPNAGELNWASLTNFLVALGNNAAVAEEMKQAIRVATTSPVTVASATDFAVVVDLTVAGPSTVNLPAGSNGQLFVIVDGKGDAATNNITIVPNGSETIKGAANLVLNKNRQTVLLQYNTGSTDWKLLQYDIPVDGVTPSDLSGVIPADKGGTGVANNVASTLTRVGAHDLQITTSGATTLTVPTTGTVATLAGSESFTNKDLQSATNVLTGATAGSFVNTGTITLPTATTTLVGRDTADILTNKDIDGGTASNSRRITLPQDTYANLLLLTRKEGTLLYANDQDVVYYDDGTNLVPVGSGSGSGGINYIENPSAALNLDGWVASGAGVTLARTTTGSELPRESLTAAGLKITPVSGTTDYVRYRFTLGDVDKNKLLQIQWAQKALAGYVAGDLVVEMYTNTLSDYSGSYTQLVLSEEDIPAADVVFLTTFNSTTADYYELRIRRTAGVNAIVLQDVNVGPGINSVVPAIQDWQTFTPSWSGLGTGTITAAKYSLIGRNLLIELSATNFEPVGTLFFDVPGGYTVDQTIIPTLSQSNRISVGQWSARVNGADFFAGDVSAASASQLVFSIYDGTSATNALINASLPSVWSGASEKNFSFTVAVPVVEASAVNVVSALGQNFVTQNIAGLVERAGQLKGTNTNDNALAGYVGEAKTVLVTTPTNVPTSAAGFTMGSITLTAGDWDISASVHYSPGTATLTGGSIKFQGFYTASGMTGIPGVNYAEDFNISPSQFNGITLTLPTIRVTSDGTDLNVAGQAVAGTQVIDLQGYIDGFSAGNPQYTCYLLARRVR